jgi:hypothetical protein
MHDNVYIRSTFLHHTPPHVTRRENVSGEEDGRSHFLVFSLSLFVCGQRAIGECALALRIAASLELLRDLMTDSGGGNGGSSGSGCIHRASAAGSMSA